MEELRSNSDCPGCVARDRVIAEAFARIEQLTARVADLERRLDLKERASKRQAAPFSKGEPNPNPKKPGRKSGNAHGKHAHRLPPAEEQIVETLEAPLPEACPHCGGAVVEDEGVDEQFQTDLPDQPLRRKFRIHKGTCKACRKRVRGRHPLQTSDAVGAAQSQLGPHAQASVVYLNKRAGMSYGKIADCFREAHGIELRPSTATRIVLRNSDQLETTYDEIKESIAHSKIVVPDETGWREGGRPVWLHVAVGDEATCYVIDRRRNADTLENLIGLNFSGYLVRDGFASYDRFEDATHQLCMAHALRRARTLEETLFGQNKRFPQQILDQFQEALALRDAFRVGEADRAALAAAHDEHVERLHRLTSRVRADERNNVFARHLAQYGPGWLQFLLEPDLPATNFLAEQALRTPIVNRKVFGGNRTAAGCRAQERICSAIQTCRQQKQSALAFLRDAICGRIRSIFANATQLFRSTAATNAVPVAIS